MHERGKRPASLEHKWRNRSSPLEHKWHNRYSPLDHKLHNKTEHKWCNVHVRYLIRGHLFQGESSIRLLNLCSKGEFMFVIQGGVLLPVSHLCALTLDM